MANGKPSLIKRNILPNQANQSWLGRLARKTFTFVIIPHSERRASNFEVSYLTLGLVALLLVTSISVAILIPRLWQQDVRDFQERERQHVADSLETERILGSVSQIAKVVQDLSTVVNDLNSSMELPSAPIGKAKMGIGGDSAEHLLSEEADHDHKAAAKTSEYEVLKHIVRDLLGVKEQLSGHSSYMKNFAHKLNKIPSIHPLLGRGYMLSAFGPRIDPIDKSIKLHNGIDIGEMPGTPIRAAADGTVIHAEASGGAGLYVVIEHAYGFSTHYMHMQSFRVKKGDLVKRGQIVGLVGNTGRSTGAHLHYEVRINGEPLDPKPYIDLDIAPPSFPE